MAVNDVHTEPAINATTQIVTGATRVRRLICTAPGTAGTGTSIYDNTATTGTPVFTSPNIPTVGQVFDLDIPLAVGLRIVVPVNGPQFTVIYG